MFGCADLKYSNDRDSGDTGHRDHPAQRVRPRRERVCVVLARSVVNPREHHDELQGEGTFY